MTGLQLKRARKERGWTQAEASRRLRVTQAYVSMLERDKRPLSPRLARRTLRVLPLPAVALPLPQENELDLRQAWQALSDDDFSQELGTLGYVGFGHLKGKTPRWNPAELLLAMLTRSQLDARVREALPWVPFHHPDMDWTWLLRHAKLNDVQNRLGFVVTLAATLALQRKHSAEALRAVLQHLVEARLAKEDTLANENMTQVERRWLRENRPPEAAEWNLLTDLKLEHLAYARD